MTKTKRLKILSESERKSVYERPDFSGLERQHYFALPDTQWQAIKNLPVESIVYFILQFGYFNAKHQFYKFSLAKAGDDVAFIMAVYMPNRKYPKTIPSRNTQGKLKKKILAFFKYSSSREKTKSAITRRLRQLVRYHNDHHQMFREISCFLEQKRLVLPAYSTMQDLISTAIIGENERLCNKIDKLLPKYAKEKLKALLEVDNDFYKLTSLKHDLRDFSYKQMKGELQKHLENRRLYHFAARFLPKLKISQQNIHYCASLANYYTLYKLRRMSESTAQLYLLCYVYFRYEKTCDNLIQAFVYHRDNYAAEAGIAADKIILNERKQLDLDNKKMGLLLGFYTDKSMFEWSFDKVAEKAYGILPEEMIEKIKQHLTNHENYRTNLIWEHHEKKQRTIAMNLRPIFKALEFECNKTNNPVMEAAKFLQLQFAQGIDLKNIDTSKLPRRLISPAKCVAMPAKDFGTSKSPKSAVMAATTLLMPQPSCVRRSTALRASEQLPQMTGRRDLAAPTGDYSPPPAALHGSQRMKAFIMDGDTINIHKYEFLI